MSYLSNGSSSPTKINLNLGSLPTYISSTQAPTKRLPWRIMRNSDCIYSATLLLPDELYGLIWQAVESDVPKIRYAKVVMKLEELLDGEFLNEYIKRGMHFRPALQPMASSPCNILMISEGDTRADNVFSIKEGILSMELSKDDYERTGLQGSPVRSGGRKHVKTRYC
ncbi:uncharacterized protein A1O9_12769 [Exophiala aquamarina CBS 119918]|uniref:Uncharacterized protein n=1 Tax=Exophiala aquamarina CBS 119918 TaxID=1182545 RepID=A0A072P6A4_9EURO|nr:uncharacterized protein A1O9_12769 [Exophiala aquamarina CBS 119918]KEF51155.1 hypothetical protein A1O9_12769 [Exophiala aquamarina CBS 119918]